MRFDGSPTSDFRREINGLRALAVIAVVLYHFHVPVITAGFVGVDCFFVISGYLMTKIIDGGIADGRFSIARFWEARAIRIIPALAVLLAAVLIFGYFFIEPGGYRTLANSASFAALFVSDWKFALDQSYFNPSSEENWLLHTWSLSVEWQFYMVYPLAYLALSRVRPLWNCRLPILVAMCVFSFALNVLMVRLGGRWATVAFFLLPDRAWEMLLGGAVYLLQVRQIVRLGRSSQASLEGVGLLLLLVSAVIFDRFSRWPSFGAALPTMGSALIILADRGDSTLLRSPVFQSIGIRSYSIYLWHWPLVVGQRYLGDPGSVAQSAAVIVCAIAFGYASFRFVETPARLWARARRLKWVRGAALASACLVVGAISIVIDRLEGLASRAPGDHAAMQDAMAATENWAFPKGCQGVAGSLLYDCYTHGDTPPAAIVFGDSHAQMLYPAFAAHSLPNVDFVTNAGCVPAPNLERRAPEYACDDYHRLAIKYILKSGARRVLYASVWVPYFDFFNAGDMLVCLKTDVGCKPLRSQEDIDEGFKRLYAEIDRLRQAGKDVTIMLPIPAPNRDVPFELRVRLFKGLTTKVEPVRLDARPEAEEIVRRGLLGAKEHGATIVDPRDFLCKNKICPVVSDDGHSLYIDNSHLRPDAVRRLTPFFNSLFVER